MSNALNFNALDFDILDDFNALQPPLDEDMFHPDANMIEIQPFGPNAPAEIQPFGPNAPADDLVPHVQPAVAPADIQPPPVHAAHAPADIQPAVEPAGAPAPANIQPPVGAPAGEEPVGPDVEEQQPPLAPTREQVQEDVDRVFRELETVEYDIGRMLAQRDQCMLDIIESVQNPCNTCRQGMLSALYCHRNHITMYANEAMAYRQGILNTIRELIIYRNMM